jgi:hypothetical protein
MTIAPEVGNHQRRRRALQGAGGDDPRLPQPAGRGEAAQGGGDEEPGDADPEGADAADPVAELAPKATRAVSAST